MSKTVIYKGLRKERNEQEQNNVPWGKIPNNLFRYSVLKQI